MNLYKTSVEPHIYRLVKEWDVHGETKITVQKGKKVRVERSAKEKELISKFRKGLIWKDI